MTEKDKMLLGELYDSTDAELTKMRAHAHMLCRKYNSLDETDCARESILDELLPKGVNRKGTIFLQGPIFFDYGAFTKIGENTYANFNFTCLDCAPVNIGKNVFIGPNVSLLTPMHPLRFKDRNIFVKSDGTLGEREYAKPITICDNCWIAGNVTICGGVTIGEGSVIGAGSVVTRDIPSNVVAVGSPCKVLKKIDNN